MSEERSTADLLAEAKRLTAEFKGVSKPGEFVNERPPDYPPRAYTIPLAYYPFNERERKFWDTKDYTIIDIYLPTTLPEHLIDPKHIVRLHGHKSLLPCRVEDMCHEYGFSIDRPEFRMKWSHIYKITKAPTGMDLRLI